jgi:hypothetical protein
MEGDITAVKKIHEKVKVARAPNLANTIVYEYLSV